jgi:hypothetical protein
MAIFSWRFSIARDRDAAEPIKHGLRGRHERSHGEGLIERLSVYARSR